MDGKDGHGSPEIDLTNVSKPYSLDSQEND
jgi:hypothetical protein